MATTRGSHALTRALRGSQWQRAIASQRYATTAAAVEYNEPQPYIPDRVPPPSRSTPVDRKQAVQNAKPFSEFLTDTFHRQHDYLRISVTERCNLRCLYCMPEEGVQLSPNKDILTSAEIYYLSALFVNQGVNKIRLTGGEPTVRKDIVPLMQQIGSLRRNGLKELALTTNAISLHRKLDAMVEAGLTGVNISLDTLDPFEFQLLTRRQGFDAVMKSINRIQEMNKVGAGVKLKINAVVMRGLNDHQILPFVEKTRDEDIEVRFIEYMPFGGNKWSKKKMLPYSEMLDIIREKYPDIGRLKDARNDTSKTYQVPGFKGRVGFITSMTHNFCGTCNRLRITSDGNLKVCLHGNTEISLRDILRQDHGGEPMHEAAFEAIRQLELDRRQRTDLHFDGEEGWMSKEQQLLDVIGAAVKRKKAKHAGIGKLENMENRPMILIGEQYQPIQSPSHPSMYRHSPIMRHHHQRSPPIPLHLLNSLPAQFAQARYYSSDSRNGTDIPAHTTADGAESITNSEPGSGFANAFGFQSLRELFHQPTPRYRYSRPREDDAQQKPASLPQSSMEDSRLEEVENERSAWGLSASTTADRRDSGSPSGSLEQDASVVSSYRLSNAETAESTEGSNVKIRYREHWNMRKHIAGSQFRPATWKNSEILPRRYRGKDLAKVPGRTPNIQSKQPWGLSPESQAHDDMAANGEAVLPSHDRQQPTVQDMPAAEVAIQSASQQTPESTPQATHGLTHVNSSGEARMVDVGAKAATKRTAIATTYVSFSNPEPFRLIFENANKKGDVLGVARVAGIMGAKRTSELIPLCHPIPISKVEVEVKLVPPSGRSNMFRKSGNGLVYIEALVECTGPTGVEMEALTAATTAALTVYDMCKAVDRLMHIEKCAVAYKSGGNSGLSAHRGFAIERGEQYFVERGLEVPTSVTSQDERAQEVRKVIVLRSNMHKITTGH